MGDTPMQVYQRKRASALLEAANLREAIGWALRPYGVDIVRPPTRGTS